MLSPVGWDLHPNVSAWSGLPALAGDVSADACVVGLGASGLAAIESLIDRGLSVIGVDAGRVAAGAAGRNGGFLLGGADAYLHSVIAAWGADAAVWLYRETLRELDHLYELLPDVVCRDGSIRLAGLPGDAETEDEANDRAAEIADCVLHENALRTHGIAVERYEGPLGTGLYLPDDASMNPARRALGLATLLQRSASLYEHSPVVQIAPKRVVCAGGDVTADVVIVAIDGGLELVLPQLVGRVRTARLQMVATAPIAPGRLPCPVYGRWGYDYAQQDAAGRVFCGGGRDLHADQEWTSAKDPSEPVQQYVQHLASRFAGEPIEVTNRWAASVGFTNDGRPLCSPADDGVYAVGGYNGTGNLVGPVAARAAVSLALDGTVPPSCFAS